MTDETKLNEAYDIVLSAEREKLKRLEDELRSQATLVDALIKRVGSAKVSRRQQQPAMAARPAK